MWILILTVGLSLPNHKHERKSDEELVRASLADEDAFYFLMKRYEPKLLRYVHRMTRISREEAEDLLQDIFIKIYRNLNGFDSNLKFSTWAYRIAHNEIISQYRKKKGKPSLETLDVGHEEIEYLADFFSETLNVETQFFSLEKAAQVRKAIGELPPKYRDILVLRYLEEMSYKEIGDILRKPSGSVATLVNRAKAKFKKVATKRQLGS